LSTYYSILGVNEYADINQIRAAYREQQVPWRLIENRKLREAAKKRSPQLIRAYEVLTNPQARNEYDR
jgi:DnaJ-class molecular chaperone